MANVNSLTTNSSSNMSSLYGTRNVLSGLASGMDTESMIENSVSGYKTKITQLEQQQTKCQWKQDAYRSITDKMYSLTQKYTSYTSKTNLYSNAFFNNSISTTAVGPAEATSKVSATGRSTSDIQILAAQAATAASYSVSADALGLNSSNTVTKNITNNWNTANIEVGTLKGTMTLNYDGQKIDITFDESDKIDGTNTPLVQAIQEKLKNATVNTKFGAQKASELISVSEEGGNITFTDIGNHGASPHISYMDSSLKTALGATESALYSGSSDKKYTLSQANGNFTDTKTAAEYVSEKEISVTVDGVTKNFRLDKTLLESGDVKGALEKGLKSVGADVKVEQDSVTGELTFTPNNSTSQFSISAKDAKANEILGFGDGISNYLSEKSSIGTLLGANFDFSPTAAAKETAATAGNVEQEGSTNFYVNQETGIRYEKDGDDYYRVNDKGDRLYELKINDKSVYVSKDDSLESVLNNINNSDMGVKASYSKLTGTFVFAAKETGASSAISFGNGDGTSLTEALFGRIDRTNTSQYTAGANAKIRAKVNGVTTDIIRASNTFDMDGMTVTLKGNINDLSETNEANEANAVSFSTSSGSDDLIKTIREFVDEYNAVMKETYNAYATQPAEKNSKTHARYEPLTDADKDGMSEKAIESYEAKAKQGILFGDSDLRALYERMVNIISPGGNDGAALRNMGIETSYSGGLTQITLNEEKLRDALSKDPDSVRNAFTKSKEDGASTDGLMSSVKSVMEQYASASYSTPGILVKKAGSTYNSTSLLNNEMQKQLDNIQTKIEQWQTKMGTKIDYYTRQFTALEKLMNTMNSQSSALAGLMGG